MLMNKGRVAIIAAAVTILLTVYLLQNNSQEEPVTSNTPIKSDYAEETVVNGDSPINEHVVSDVEKQPLTSEKLDISLPKTKYALPQKDAPVDIMGGIYDETAKAPESEIQQSQDAGDIGYYDPNALAPEHGYENMPVGEGPKVIDKKQKKKKDHEQENN